MVDDVHQSWSISFSVASKQHEMSIIKLITHVKYCFWYKLQIKKKITLSETAGTSHAFSCKNIT